MSSFNQSVIPLTGPGSGVRRNKILPAGSAAPQFGQAYPIVRQLQERLGDQLLFVSRNFPPRQIHPHAEHAAEAAEFAAAYGSFWKMHDILFENQEYVQDELLVGLVAQIGLSAHKLRRSLESEIYRGQSQPARPIRTASF